MRASSIDRRSQPLVNLILNPTAKNNVTGWGGNGVAHTRVATGGVDGGAFGRMTKVGAGQVNSFGTYIFPTVAPLAGSTVSGLMWVRSSAALTVFFGIEQTPGLGSNTPLVPNTWTKVSFSGLRVGGMNAIICYASYNFLGGETVDFDHWMFCQSDTPLQDYQDGDSPGWQWRGAAHNSESVGYPILPLLA